MQHSVLITGGNRGIGLALTERFLQARWRVWTTARRPEASLPLLQLAALYRETLTVLPLELRDPAQVAAVAAALHGEALELLINNAGIWGPESQQLPDLDAASWLEVLEVNLVAPILFTRALLPSLRRHAIAHRPRLMTWVINIGSRMGSMADNSTGADYCYRTAKAGLNAATVSMTHDLRHQGIGALAISPGYVITDMTGPEAEITAKESAERMFKVLTTLTPHHNGGFLDLDGQRLPW